MKAMRFATVGTTVVAVAVGAVFMINLPKPAAQATPGESSGTNEEAADVSEPLSRSDEVVDPDDPIMRCEGPKKRGSEYKCGRDSSEVVGSRTLTLPPVRVTDYVAGCLPGNQPSVSKSLRYATAVTVAVSAGVKLDLKLFAGGKDVFGQIKEFGPGVGAGLSYAWTTTFGEENTYTIPADYGKISWGIFSQDAVESTVNETVAVRNTHIGYNDNYYYTAHGMKVVTPIQDDKTKFPHGTLAKDQRNFADMEEFRSLCPNGEPPDYL